VERIRKASSVARKPRKLTTAKRTKPLKSELRKAIDRIAQQSASPRRPPRTPPDSEFAARPSEGRSAPAAAPWMPKKARGFTDEHVLKALRYIEDVLDGTIPACQLVKNACRRQLRDLDKYKGDDSPFIFDEKKAAGRVCRFIELLPHVKGPKAKLDANGKPECIVLEGWQCFILTTVFGWRRRDTGGRRFRRVYIEVPRGNAKSTISSAVGVYGLTSDGEMGAEIYSAATTRDQAKIVFGDARTMLLRKDDFRVKLGVAVNTHALIQIDTNSQFIPLSREAKSLDGKNVHIAIIDELHAHPTREVYDVIETATGKRYASLLWAITTAGSDSSGICYEVRTYCVKVLEGTIEDDSQFAVIYTIDDGDDWTQEATWRKANPNWGVSVMPDVIASLARKAMQLPSAQSNFKTKHLNVWVNADLAWMDMRSWDACADTKLSIDDFIGEESFGSLDLATKTDLVARATVFKRHVPTGKDPKLCSRCGLDYDAHPMEATDEGTCAVERFRPNLAREPHYYGFLTCYLPEVALTDGRNSQYQGWEIEGRIITNPGEVIDFGLVEQDILNEHARLNYREFAYDPWQATQLAQNCTAAGVTMVEIRQTVAMMSAPMKEFAALILSRRFHHDGNPLFRWMMSNVVAHLDAKDNTYPRKQRPENKIDGPVAMIMCLARAMVYAQEEEPYTPSRGLRTI